MIRTTLMKSIATIAAIAFGAAAMAIPVPGDTQSVNRMVAVVNNTPITQVQLNALMATAPQGQQPTEKMALQALINQTLQMAIAKKAGVKVSDADVNHAITGIAKQNNMSVAKMKTQILQGGMTWDAYKQQIHKQILLAKIQQQAVAGKVNVSNAEVSHYIQHHADQLGAQNKYQYSDLLIPTSSTVSEAKATDYAKQVIKAWQPGVKLATLAQKMPASANASMLSTSEWQTPDNIPDVFMQPLNHLAKGALSQPIVTGNGVHLLQLDKRVLTSQKVLKQRAMQVLSQQAFMKAVKDWVSGLRKSSYVKIFNTADNA